MSIVEESGLLIADKLQPHLRDLQRPEEVHFDPVSLAVVFSFFLLRHIADGIGEGIQQSAADVTKSLLDHVKRAVRKRAAPGIAAAMESDSEPATIAKLQAEAETTWAHTRQISRSLKPEQSAEVAEAASNTMADALAAAGLPDNAVFSVRVTINTETQRLLTQPD
jgi:hypothetical protein